MKYFYVTDRSEEVRQLAEAEATAITGGTAYPSGIVVADQAVDWARSAYILCGGSLIGAFESVEALCDSITPDQLERGPGILTVRKIPRGLELGKHVITQHLGLRLGKPASSGGEGTDYLLVATEQMLWFGEALPPRKRAWGAFADKPYDLSIAIASQMARALVNLALHPTPPAPDAEPCAAGRGCALLDPCCGSGTILIQAAAMGLRVVGFDKNLKMIRSTRGNLRYFGLPAQLAVADAASVRGHYDVVVTNLPYDRFCPISPEQLGLILDNLVHLAGRQVLVAGEDIRPFLDARGYRVRKVISVPARSLERRIFVCGN